MKLGTILILYFFCIFAELIWNSKIIQIKYYNSL